MRSKRGAILVCFFVFALVFAFFETKPVQAAKAEKTVKQFEIAVVFDNSGSMYHNTDAWCKAKYAMEIFASMLSYENGDLLKVYPMWEVTTDGSKPNSGGSVEPISINSVEDIDKLSQMYTVDAGGTPFEPVRTAYNDLKKSKADQKWLVILTDGEFDRDNRTDKKDIELQSEIKKLTSNGIKIQYLGFGEADKLKADESRYLYANKATSESLSEDLINICNTIFHRAVLPKKYIKDDRLTFDMSMKNVIVFAQGKNVKIKSIKNADGDSIKIINNSGQRKYSTISAGNYNKAPVDKSLAGQVVMFGKADKGVYKLNVLNADKRNVQIFYEPDVDIKLIIKDKNGKKIKLDKVDSIPRGTYTVDYALIDAKTKKDISKSDLLGKVKYHGELITSDGKKQELKQGEEVKFDADKGGTFIKVDATYLENYKISTSDDKAFYTFKITPPDKNQINMELEVMQKGDWYNTKTHEGWEPIRASITKGQKPLTDDQLKQVKITTDCSKQAEYTTKIVPGESAIDIYLGQKNGKYVEPEKGKYKLNVKASIKDKYGRDLTTTEKTHFDVQNYHKIFKILSRIIPIIALILFLLWWNLRKAYPKKMYYSCSKGTIPFKIRKNSMDLSAGMFSGEMTCKTEKKTNYMTRRKKQAKVTVNNLSIGNSVKSFSIGMGSEYTKSSSGAYIDNFGKELSPKTSFVLSENTEIRWVTNRGTRSGKVKMNHK